MKKELSPKQREELLNTLKARFEKNKDRHKGLEWDKVSRQLSGEVNAEKRWSLHGYVLTNRLLLQVMP